MLIFYLKQDFYMTVYSPDNQYYAIIELGNVRVFDVKSNSLIANLTQKKSINLPIRIVDLKFSHDSEHLLITSALSGFIVLHIPTNTTRTITINIPDLEFAHSIGFSDNNQYIGFIVHGRDSRYILIKDVITLSDKHLIEQACRYFIFESDTQIWFVDYEDNLCLFDLPTNTILKTQHLDFYVNFITHSDNHENLILSSLFYELVIKK